MNRRWSFSVLQLLLLTALCGLAAGLVASSRQQAKLGFLQQLVFSPDGRWLAACSAGGEVRVWDLHRRGSIGQRSGLSDHPTYVSPSPICFVDDTTLAHVLVQPWSAIGAELLLWDVVRDREVKRLKLPYYPGQHAVSSAGYLCATDPSDGICGTAPPASGGIDLWEITAGRKLRVLEVEWDYERLWFSADGLTLVAAGSLSEGRTQVQIWDTATGANRLVTLEAPWWGTDAAISPDAQRLAWSTSGIPVHIEVWDLASGEQVSRWNADGGCASHLEFAAGGGSIVSYSYDGELRVWDVSTGRVRASVDERNPARGRVGLWWRDRFAVFSPDGQTLATASDAAISLWDATSLEHRRDLYRDRRFVIGLVYSLGFIGWAVVWGLVARRRGGGADESPALDASQRGLPKAVQTWLSPQWAWLRFLLLALLAGLLWAWAFTDLLLSWLNWTYPARFGLIVLLTFLGLLLLVLWIAYVPGAIRRWRGLPCRWAIRRALRIADSASCRMGRAGPVTVAFLGRSHLQATFAQDYEAARQCLSELLGQPLHPQRPLTALVFERTDWYDAYLNGHLPLAGVYWMGMDRQVLICEEMCLRGLTEPRRIWQVLLARYLFEQAKGFHPTAGLAMVLGGHLMRQADSSLSQRVHRRLQVARRRKDVRLPEDPLAMPDSELTRAVLQGPPRERSLLLAGLQAQCHSYAEYLLGPEAGQRREGFTQFLRELKSPRTIAELFAKHMGEPVAFRRGWQDWSEMHPTEPAGQPGPVVGEYSRRVLLPLIREDSAVEEQPAEAIRSLGSAGYEIGVDLLIDVLEKDRSGLREDVVWALESISGCSYGADVPAWRQWWAARPRILPEDTVFTAEFAEADGDVIVAELADAGGAGTLSQRSNAPPSGEPISAGQLQLVWTLLLLGGLAAVLGSVAWGMYQGPSALAIALPGALTGVYAITRSSGRQTRGLRAAARLLMLNLLLGNVVSGLLGLLAALQLRGARLPD